MAPHETPCDIAGLGEVLRALTREFHAGAATAGQPGDPTLTDAEIEFSFSFDRSRGLEFQISLLPALLSWRRRFSRRDSRLQSIRLCLKHVAQGPTGSGGVATMPGSLAGLLAALRTGLGRAANLPATAPRLAEAEIQVGAEFGLSRESRERLLVAAFPVTAAWTRRAGSIGASSSTLLARFSFDSGKDKHNGGD